ncbi:MAG: hypothetical protein WAO58_08530 [Fimbriimonadaceae bacterium]
MRRPILSLLALFLAALVLSGCPVGSRHGADAETSLRGATEAADIVDLPQTTSGQGGEGSEAVDLTSDKN